MQAMYTTESTRQNRVIKGSVYEIFYSSKGKQRAKASPANQTHPNDEARFLVTFFGLRFGNSGAGSAIPFCWPLRRAAGPTFMSAM
jgi:hypothetical protein